MSNPFTTGNPFFGDALLVPRLRYRGGSFLGGAIAVLWLGFTRASDFLIPLWSVISVRAVLIWRYEPAMNGMMSYAAKNEKPVAFPPSDEGSFVRVWFKNPLVKIPAMRVNTLTWH